MCRRRGPHFCFSLLTLFVRVQYLVRRDKVADNIAKWVVILLCRGHVYRGIRGPAIAIGYRALIDCHDRDSIIAGLYFLIGKYFPASETDALAVVTAEVGVVFCSVVLVTGPLWARPVWGIWWTWDVRLTSTLVLWLIYISYLMLRRFSTSGQTPVLAAALAIFGALDVPLVYFSIWIFRTQHPQPVIGGGGSIDPRMLHVLLINWLAFLCFAALICWSRYRLEILQREVEEVQALEALHEPRRPR